MTEDADLPLGWALALLVAVIVLFVLCKPLLLARRARSPARAAGQTRETSP